MTSALGASAAARPLADRIDSLTGLRGVAAVLVVVYHYSASMKPTNAVTTFMTHGYLAVDLFFVLSGFVMALSYGHMFAAGWSRAAYLRFLGRRIARIYPLYFVATVIAFFLVETGPVEYAHTLPDGAALGLNVMMVETWGFVESFDSPGWSISAEWAAYLLFPALLVPTIFARPARAWLCALICALTLAALCLFSVGIVHTSHARGAILDLSHPWLGLPLVRCVPEFTLGILAFRLANTRVGTALRQNGWICAMIGLSAIAFMTVPGTDLAVVLVFPLLVVSLASGRHLPGRLLASRPAAFLGTLSYSIYLTHILLVDALLCVTAQTYGSVHEVLEIYWPALGILMTIPFAFVAHKTIEIPGSTWLRAMLEKRPDEATLDAVARTARM